MSTDTQNANANIVTLSEDKVFKAFISFKGTDSADREAAELLREQLDSQGFSVFLSGIDYLSPEVTKALDEADVLYLVASDKENISHPSVNEEWSSYMNAVLSGRKENGPIILLLKNIDTKELPIQLERREIFGFDHIDDAALFGLRIVRTDHQRVVAAPTPQPKQRPLKKAVSVFSIVVICLLVAAVSIAITLLLIDPGIIQLPDGSVTVLDLTGKELEDISYIDKYYNLKELYIGAGFVEEDNTGTSEFKCNSISDISALSKLPRLNTLDANSNSISDISPLSDISDISYLDLSSNSISDITPLRNNRFMRYLNLNNNQISHIYLISDFKELRELNLGSNQISDVSALAGLTKLEKLNISQNQITDISALSNLTSLTELHIGSNPIDDISPVSNLSQLTYLNADGLEFSDCSVFKDMKDLVELNLWMCHGFNDLSGLSGLTNLKILDLGWVQIEDISPLAGLNKLEHLNLQFNNVEDISPLANLKSLKQLQLEDTPVEDYSPLYNLTGLEHLSLSSYGISEGQINELREHLPNCEIAFTSNY